ncbi:uncharacterized protein [Palaemon carinicauda]|uniref:uncharacterized protein n=1 Tax=Palaemon carinicauda TaxID=392227 RepID=UPI0035B60A16
MMPTQDDWAEVKSSTEALLEDLESETIKTALNKFDRFSGNISLTLKIEISKMTDNGTYISNFFYLRTTPFIVTLGEEDEFINHTLENLPVMLEERMNAVEGSGWNIRKIAVMELFVSLRELGNIGHFTPYPAGVGGAKNIININSGYNCLITSLIAFFIITAKPEIQLEHLHRDVRNKIGGDININFNPTAGISLESLKTLEKDNDINIYIYALKKIEKSNKVNNKKHYIVYLARTGGYPSATHFVPLLLINDVHIALIRNLLTFMKCLCSYHRQVRHKRVQSICKKCSTFFSSDDLCHLHTSSCQSMTTVSFPPRGSYKTFKNPAALLKRSHIAFMDLEAYNIYTPGDQKIIAKQKPFAYAYVIVNGRTCEYVSHRIGHGEDCIDVMLNNLTSDWKDICESLSKYPLHMTEKSLRDFKEAVESDVCKVKFNENIPKNRHHLHYLQYDNYKSALSKSHIRNNGSLHISKRLLEGYADEVKDLVLKTGKQFYPYDYVTGYDILLKDGIPTRTKFNNRLTSSSISEDDYEHIKSTKGSLDAHDDIGYFILYDTEHVEDSVAVRTDAFPLAMQHLNITKDMISKYSQDLLKELNINIPRKNRKLVGAHLPMNNKLICLPLLQTLIRLGLKILTIKGVYKFRQEYYLREYIAGCAAMRARETDCDKKSTIKVMMNSLFGVTIKNQLNYSTKSVIVDNEDTLLRNVSKHTFKSVDVISEDRVIVNHTMTNITADSPIYIGFSILDLSKKIMYDFFYDTLVRLYGEKIKLLYMDTDSFFFTLEVENLDDESKGPLKEYFDLSNFPEDHQLHDAREKGSLGLLKLETANDHITEFVGVKPKLYSYKTMNSRSNTLKGIQQSIQHSIEHQQYKDSIGGSDILTKEGYSLQNI